MNNALSVWRDSLPHLLIPVRRSLIRWCTMRPGEDKRQLASELELPYEIYIKIFAHLSPTEIARLQLVSKVRSSVDRWRVKPINGCY